MPGTGGTEIEEGVPVCTVQVQPIDDVSTMWFDEIEVSRDDSEGY